MTNFQAQTNRLRNLNGQGWPIVSNVEVTECDATLCLEISDDLSYFQGHFPNKPVLPGIVQVHWAGEYAQALFGLSGFHKMQKVKFVDMVLPRSTVILNLQHDSQRALIKFQYQITNTELNRTVSTGVLQFKPQRPKQERQS